VNAPVKSTIIIQIMKSYDSVYSAQTAQTTCECLPRNFDHTTSLYAAHTHTHTHHYRN